MKRTRCTPKTNPKKLCSSDSESGMSEPQSVQKDNIKVYCRVRPLQSERGQSFITVVPPKTIKVSAVDSNRDGIYKETEYVFRHVFDERSTQSDIFKKTSLELVNHLIEGRNGVLFAYGITGSGKTYTMTGTSDNIGIMPRCIELLFKTIEGNQLQKFMLKPDKMNGFEIQSEFDAMMERRREETQHIKTPTKFRMKESEIDMMTKRSARSSRSDFVPEMKAFTPENSYSVFITYVEIYNNAVYDLLDESDEVLRHRPPQAKLIREDGTHNMFVHGAKEVEVKSYEEGFELYFKGQRKRRLAGTAMNSESSRSHSIFTIRVVQAPLHAYGDSQCDKSAFRISQLSLVDLAGSERTAKAKTGGQRLREAGLINNSLLTLKTCLEILRENQLNGTNKMIPYRESRLTYFFKNYFEGIGDIRMVVCVSPGAYDYDETLHVLKFSEMSQEVLVNRTPQISQIFATPTSSKGKTSNANTRPILPLKPELQCTPLRSNDRYSSGIDWSTFFVPKFPDSFESISSNNLISIIKQRMIKEKESYDVLVNTVNSLRKNVIDAESNMRNSNCELKRLVQQLNDKSAECLEIENRYREVQIRYGSLENDLQSLQEEIAEKDEKQTEEQNEIIVKERNRYKNKLANNKEKFNKELQRQKSVLEFEIHERDHRMQQVKRVLGTPSTSTTSAMLGGSSHMKLGSMSAQKSTSDSSTSTSNVNLKLRTPRSRFLTLVNNENSNNPQSVIGTLDLASTTNASSQESTRPLPSIPVSDPRHRRSRSAGGDDRWLDHKPLTAIPLNTVMQPVMKRRKSVSKLTDVKDVVNSKTSKYCLTTQALDSDGDLETCLYKGDVVPTAGGGAQVMFNDVEVLHHKSPQTSPMKGILKSRKECPTTISDRCATSLEGHKSSK